MKSVENNTLERIYKGASGIISSINEEPELILPDMEELPLRIERSELLGVLAGVRLVQVDDRPEVIACHALDLSIATLGEARSVLNIPNDTVDTLIDRVRGQKPIVTLMDRKMLGDIRGPDLIKGMPDVAHIGFAHETDLHRKAVRQEFLQAGAIEFVPKGMSRTEVRQNIRFIADIVRSRILAE